MSFNSWGNYPKINSEVISFHQDVTKLQVDITQKRMIIPYGNGRSYGDSALSDYLIHTRPHHFFLGFDKKDGILHVQSGVLLSEILELVVPRGWFLKVTPGTKRITVGGAIASDVHGKNHHVDGCFSESVIEFQLMLSHGNIVICSREVNSELFHATCGGMGLTGIILDSKIKLTPIKSSNIQQCVIKTRNLEDTFSAFERYKDRPYSVAWIDCFSKKKKLGRGLVSMVEFSDKGALTYCPQNIITLPKYMPSAVLLNSINVKLFNQLYYYKYSRQSSYDNVSLDAFFYPLDRITNWNDIYGKSGFTQYQFIFPKQISFDGISEVLTKINYSDYIPFLAVLKLYGKENSNYLSFPMEGYSLALDFKIKNGLFDFLDELDEIVVKYNGRIYLSKDVRMSRYVFEQGYPRVKKFRELRKKYELNKTFNSLQSQRLGL